MGTSKNVRDHKVLAGIFLSPTLPIQDDVKPNFVIANLLGS